MVLLPLLLCPQTGSVPTPHESAVALYRQHEYAKAAELFERAIATEEKDSPPYRESAVFLGQSYYLSGKIREAIPWLERAEQSGVNAIEVSYMLGNAYIQTRRPEKAVPAFE